MTTFKRMSLDRPRHLYVTLISPEIPQRTQHRRDDRNTDVLRNPKRVFSCIPPPWIVSGDSRSLDQSDNALRK